MPFEPPLKDDVTSYVYDVGMPVMRAAASAYLARPTSARAFPIFAALLMLVAVVLSAFVF